jgi:hypothetical protein
MNECKFCTYPDKALIEQKIASKELSMIRAAELTNSNKGYGVATHA